MKRVFYFLTIVSFALLGTGCATLAPPERPAYTGTDNISSAEANQLVGVWRVKALNPYPDAPSQTTIIEYHADGRVGGKIQMNNDDPNRTDPFADMQFDIQGQWVLNIDTITHKDIQMISTTDNAMSAMIANIINQQRGISGQANIYELSSDRIVMVGNDGTAMEYSRQ